MYSEETKKGTVWIGFVREALGRIYALDLDAESLLDQAGISPALMALPEARVAPANFSKLWHLIARTLDDEFFGMDRRPMKSGSFTLLCHSIIHAQHLEPALQRALRFLRLQLDEIDGCLEREGSIARILVHEQRAAPNAFAAGTFLIIMHGLACWLVGRRIPLLSADFRSPAPALIGEWEMLFTPEVRFGQAATSITFSADFLDMENCQNEATMKKFLREAPASFLEKYRNNEGASMAVRQLLKQVEPTAWPSFRMLARQMHTSVSTLRRRLDQEGQTYQSIKDHIRRDLAINLLSQSTASMLEITQELGFAEPSAFHRAFKKWTGLSPGAYRSGG